MNFTSTFSDGCTSGIEYQLTYAPSSSTKDLISLGTANSIISAQSNDLNDINSYTRTVQARQVGTTTWLDTKTITLNYFNPCPLT